MNSGLYAACAGLLARTQALEVAANNLANINTNGYKAQLPSFHSVLATANENVSGNELSAAVNNFGVLGDSRTNLAQGALEHTGSDLDFAIQGEGWFAVQTGAGRLYTRNGNFHVDRNGRLTTAAVELVALQRHADMLQQALTSFHTNFNRIAAQDLSRI